MCQKKSRVKDWFVEVYVDIISFDTYPSAVVSKTGA